MITFLKVFLCLLLAITAGLVFFRSLNRFLKIILLQLILAMIVQVLGKVYGMNNLHVNNLIYNIYITIEVLVLAGANAIYLHTRKDKLLMIGGFALFAAAMVFDISQKTIFVFSDHAFIVECLLMVVLYLMLITREVIPKTEKMAGSPLFWVGIGSIVYFGCDIPFFSMRPYFEKMNSHLITSLFIVNLILLNFRYFFVTIAFFLQRKQSL